MVLIWYVLLQKLAFATDGGGLGVEIRGRPWLPTVPPSLSLRQ